MCPIFLLLPVLSLAQDITFVPLSCISSRIGAERLFLFWYCFTGIPYFMSKGICKLVKGGFAMKRDLDVFRHILLEVEKIEKPTLMKNILGPYDEKTVSFHIDLLLDEKYIEAHAERIRSKGVHGKYRLERMTNAGHDFLDNIRNDTIWSKTKAEVLKVGESASLDIIKSIASKLILMQLGLQTLGK